MKTLKKDGEYKRVADTKRVDKEKLDILIKNGWGYCPKSEWKKEARKEIKPKEKKKKKR